MAFERFSAELISIPLSSLSLFALQKYVAFYGIANCRKSSKTNLHPGYAIANYSKTRQLLRVYQPAWINLEPRISKTLGDKFKQATGQIAMIMK